MNNTGVPMHILKRAAAGAHAARGKAMTGVGDYVEPFTDGIRPATSMPLPAGPADFPVQQGPFVQPTTVEGWLSKLFDLGTRILEELIRQNIAARPVIRSGASDENGTTLDWNAVGVMDRLMIRNKGPNSVWYGFDRNGPAVQAATSDESFELQTNESVNVTHCRYQKIGLRCAPGGSAVVHAIGFQTVAGNQAAAIS